MKCTMFNTIVYCLTIGTVLLKTGDILAADRTVCFQMKLRDQRNCYATASEPGVRRSCSDDGYSSMKGFLVELWDKDSGDGSADDYIMTYRMGGTGLLCATVAWENASYWEGEANPDFYLVLQPKLQGATGAGVVTAKYTNGLEYAKTSWRTCSQSNPDACVAVNCPAGELCVIAPGQSLIPSSDPNTDTAKMVMAMDSAERALEVFDSAINNRTTGYTFYIDTETNILNDSDCECPRACAKSRWAICSDFEHAIYDGAPVHELGHVFHLREFYQDGFPQLDYGDGEWSITSSEWESVVTAEGWASYVAAVSWWDPSNTASYPLYHSWPIEEATPLMEECEDNKSRPLQAMRLFWDLDDTNNEAAVEPAWIADSFNASTTSLLNIWDSFPDGTANRQDEEADHNGVNLRDYDYHHASNLYAQLQHNCVQHHVDD